MSLPRMSIRAILFGVLLIAVNCAALRLVGGYASCGLVFGVFSILPMSNILAVACYDRKDTHCKPNPVPLGSVRSFKASNA